MCTWMCDGTMFKKNVIFLRTQLMLYYSHWEEEMDTEYFLKACESQPTRWILGKSCEGSYEKNGFSMHDQHSETKPLCNRLCNSTVFERKIYVVLVTFLTVTSRK